ncbi:MAG: TAXI family TRAP transporter solute-binding subunit [Pyramidobacter sp.]|nr:TAXI family TRAP transporter solute-binding subunit [Pyramidobacter sp.]
MKKRNVIALALVGIFATSTAFAAGQFIMGTGGTSGTYYPLGGAISQIITDHSGGKVACVAQATGASVENLNLLNAGDIDLALVQNDTADYAKKGEMFFKAPLKNVVAICRIYPEHIQVAVNPESGITSLAEFKDHKVSIGAPGSGNEANARQILGELGLFNGEKYEGFEPHFLSYAETTSNFKDRLIDGFMFTTGAPNSGIQEIVTAQPLRFIPIDGELRDKIIAKYPFFAPAVIEKGTYSGLTSDVQTIAVQACLVARRDMSDDEAYALTKAIFENLEALGNAHAKGKSLTLAHALDGMTLDIHPGALKYYKEVGLVK